jgi:hypothetical protein
MSILSHLLMGDARGIQSVQDLLKGATQLNLSSFHNAGLVKSTRDLSVQQILDLAPATFQMKIETEDKDEFKRQCLYRNFGYYVQRYNSSEYLKDESFWNMDNQGVAVRFYMNYRKLFVEDKRSLEYVKEELERKYSIYKIKISSNIVGILDILKTDKFEGSFEDIRNIMDNIFFGILNISEFSEGNTVGSNMEVLDMPFVERNKSKSNDIRSIEREFGVEAAKSIILEEIGKRIDNPEDIANYMTLSGTVKPFTKQGLVNKGPLTRMAFERYIQDLKHSVIYGESDSGESLQSRIMLGVNPNMGSAYENFEIIEK